MKNYKTLDELTEDLVSALEQQDNNFSKKILEFLNRGPEYLVREFKEHPSARMVAKNGDWLSLWSGGVKLGNELVSYRRIVEKIQDFEKQKSLRSQ